jgi:T-complex protein 1 subunit zeta
VSQVNAGAEVVGRQQALMVNIGAAKGLQGVLKSNLGERRSAKGALFTAS